MRMRKALANPFVLAAQGFCLGALLFFALPGADDEPMPRGVAAIAPERTTDA